ncbi:MAG TPA: hypothetical protein VJW20_02565 [Candidatus Angelobacter sp.]|nr:hypothetical protein [Candidatus Angelobacter sp.]
MALSVSLLWTVNPEWIKAIAECLTTVGVVGGGFLGLKQYSEGQRLKAADMLLGMEKEFQQFADIWNKIDVMKTYSESVAPALNKLNTYGAKADLEIAEQETMRKLDQALRFFYVCTILNGELHIEQDVIGRAYYYWLGLIYDEHERNELYEYVQQYYLRLHQWIEDHHSYLDSYKESGKWTQCPCAELSAAHTCKKCCTVLGGMVTEFSPPSLKIVDSKGKTYQLHCAKDTVDSELLSGSRVTIVYRKMTRVVCKVKKD